MRWAKRPPILARPEPDTYWEPDLLTAQGGLVLDPSAAEQKAAAANFCFVFTNSGKADEAMILCQTSGKHSYPQYEQAMQSALETSAILFAFYRKAAERRMRTD